MGRGNFEGGMGGPLQSIGILSRELWNKSSVVAEMGNRGHNTHESKRGGCCAPFVGELGPHLTQCGLGQGLLPYQVASSSIQLFGHNRRELEIGWGAVHRIMQIMPLDFRFLMPRISNRVTPNSSARCRLVKLKLTTFDK